ncbi:hypothetical protein ACE1CD_15635 [Aerosakkonema sp. BLCC-F183]|uniref:hypothetical protein n=1 Tax=Aerosakkonema sp. BLCC-F183 TaxID=3342834 RepID=UPI0035B99AA1
MNQMCKITLGRIVVSARKSQGLSQRELAELMANRFAVKFDFCELSKIENDRLDVRDRNYDWFIHCFCELFEVHRNWIEQIRQQTEPQPLDLTKAVFPVYLHDIDFIN